MPFEINWRRKCNRIAFDYPNDYYRNLSTVQPNDSQISSRNRSGSVNCAVCKWPNLALLALANLGLSGIVYPGPLRSDYRPGIKVVSNSVDALRGRIKGTQLFLELSCVRGLLSPIG